MGVPEKKTEKGRIKERDESHRGRGKMESLTEKDWKKMTPRERNKIRKTQHKQHNQKRDVWAETKNQWEWAYYYWLIDDQSQTTMENDGMRGEEKWVE